jgi:hypothetical protein
MHDLQRVTGPLEYRQSGAGEAAIFSISGCFLPVYQSCLSATLSAFRSLGTSGIATM